MEDRAARGRMDEADEVAPFKAVLHGRQWPLPIQAPDFLQERLEADAVFVDRPYLDDAVWKCCGNLTQKRAQPHLEGGLGHRICLDMPGAWFEEVRAQLPQYTPGALAAEGLTQVSAHPRRHRPSTPVVTTWMGLG